MTVTLNPATLRFSDSNLERDYAEYRNNGALLKAEKGFLVMNGFLYGIFILSELAFGNKPNPTSLFMKFLGLTAVSSQIILMRWIKSRTWIQYRFAFITLFRSLRLMLFLFGIPLWEHDPLMNDPHLLKTAMLRTGVIVNIWHALGMPLMFTEHVVLHAVHVWTTAVTTSSSTCESVLNTPGLKVLFLQIWSEMNDTMMAIAGVLKETELRDLEWNPHLMQSCDRLLMVVHVFVSFGLPTLLLWRMEIVSRQDYFRQSQRNGSVQDTFLDCTGVPDLVGVVGRWFSIAFVFECFVFSI